MDWIEQSSAELAEWLKYGMAKGWISYVYCSSHESPPVTPDEDYEFTTGSAPCIDVVRLWS
jgi:hypothetical protein